MEIDQRQPPRRWARTLGEMREELGMPATPLGASALLKDFDGDVEATPLIKQLRKHVTGRAQVPPKDVVTKQPPKAYATPVVGGTEAALDLLRREHKNALRQIAGLQERAAKSEEQMLEQERRHAALLVAERARLKEEYDGKVRADLIACRDLQRRLQSAPAATIAEMDEQVSRREKIAANSLKRAEVVWHGERAALKQQLEAEKSKYANESLRWAKMDKKIEGRLATAMAKAKALKIELEEEREKVKSMELQLEKERSGRIAVETKLQLLDRRTSTSHPTAKTPSQHGSGLSQARADGTTDEDDDNAHDNSSSGHLLNDSLDNTKDFHAALLRLQSKFQAACAELAVCRKSLRHEQAAAARDRMKLAAFEAKRAKEIAKQRCSHCGQRAAVRPGDHHGPVALADPARGGSPAHLGKMAVGQWRGREREQLQKLCMQVLGAARLAVGMPAVDPQLADTMSAMQHTWASAMQGEIEPAATMLLRSNKSATIDDPVNFERDESGSAAVPFECANFVTEEEHAAAAVIQGRARGNRERRRQRELDADLVSGEHHDAGDTGRVELLSNLVSSLSVRHEHSSSINPRKAPVVKEEGEFDAKFKLRSATRSVAMAIAASARLALGSANAVDGTPEPCGDVDQQPEALPEVIEAVEALVDSVCVQHDEALGGYVVRLVGAQGLAPLASPSSNEFLLPPPDVNAFAVVYVNGVWAGETNVALQTVAPLWNAEIVLRGAAMLHGSSPPSYAGPNTIVVALFDYDKMGNHAFLGQVEVHAAGSTKAAGSLGGLPTQDAADLPLRPHPTQPKDRIRGSVLLRICSREEPLAAVERKFIRKHSATSSTPAGGWSDEMMLLANGVLQDTSGTLTEAEKEWMDVRAAANAGDLAMRRWWSHTIQDEPGSKWVYDLVLLGADVDFARINGNADETMDHIRTGHIFPDAESSHMPDLYVECHLNGELLGHSSLVNGSLSPRWVPPHTIPLRSLQVQQGATNQLVLILCDYCRPSQRRESNNDVSGFKVVGSIELRGIGAAALPTHPTHLPLTTETSCGIKMQVGTVEVCTGRRRRDVNQRGAEAEWTDSQLAAAVESVRLSTRLRRQRTALAQTLTTMHAASRQAAAAQTRADDAEAATATLSQRLHNMSTARDKDTKARKELHKQLVSIEKAQHETVAQAVADAVHDAQAGASRAGELEAKLEQAHREAAAFRARAQHVTAELSQLKVDHAAALISGVNQRDGDGWEMNEARKRRSRFCVIM